MKTSQKRNFSIIALVLFCISFSSISQAQTDSDIVYLESEQFRSQIDALNLHNYSTNEYHLEVNLGDQTVDVIFADNSVQEKKIWMTYRESSPNVPAGHYLLDTCTGELTDFFTRVPMGELAGVWDCWE